MPVKLKQPKYKRQRFLLDMIGQLDEAATATDIQKIIFAYLQLNSETFYEFIPYKYGPYSFQLAEDIEELCKNQFIVKNSYNKISLAERQTLPLLFIYPERGDDLIRRVYREYPYYAINSEILGRLFPENERAQFKKTKELLHKEEQMLFTIGYEGRNLEGFINVLLQNDVNLLCDVRRNPISRKFGFSKSKIEHVLKAVGIQYLHIPEVGVDSGKRTCLNTPNDYENLFQEYQNNIHGISYHLDFIAKQFRKYNRIALMCFEKDVEFCHRHIIRDYLIKNYQFACEDL